MDKNYDYILALVNKNKAETAARVELFNYYKGKHKVDDRVILKHDGTVDLEKTRFSNNKLKGDFPGEIIDFMLGYFMGNPVKIKAVDDNQKDNPFIDKIKAIFKFNKSERVNMEEIKDVATKGITYELHYTDKTGPRFMKIPSEEMVVEKDDQGEITRAIRHYDVTIEDKRKTKIAIYTATDVEYLITEEETENGITTIRLVADSSYSYTINQNQDEKIEPITTSIWPHLYKQVPIIEILNNEEAQSDLDKVIDKIDEYDFRLSDNSNEIEQYRKAYLKLKGMPGTQKEDIDDAKQAGAWVVPDGGDVEFLTKQSNDAETEHHMERLERLIYRGSRTPNFNDENFYTSSGLALKLRLLPLEFKCKIKEVYFREALYKRLELINTILILTGQSGDINSIDFEFIRNMPIDDTAEVDANGKMKGLVSEETRLSRLSFVDDPQAELSKMEEENEDKVDLNNLTKTTTNQQIRDMGEIN